jgi:hypothetical protein
MLRAAHQNGAGNAQRNYERYLVQHAQNTDGKIAAPKIVIRRCANRLDFSTSQTH